MTDIWVGRCPMAGRSDSVTHSREERPLLEGLLDDADFAGAFEDARVRDELLSDLVAARKAADLTQKVVAELMETTQSAISEFENGLTDPRLSTLQRYARAIGESLSVRVGGESERPAVSTRLVDSFVHQEVRCWRVNFVQVGNDLDVVPGLLEQAGAGSPISDPDEAADQGDFAIAA
jgi:transcriptional regulator with XRE-family HTH domain